MRALVSHPSSSNPKLLPFNRGETVTVLVQEPRNGWLYGHTDSSLRWVSQQQQQQQQQPPLTVLPSFYRYRFIIDMFVVVVIPVLFWSMKPGLVSCGLRGPRGPWGGLLQHSGYQVGPPADPGL